MKNLKTFSLAITMFISFLTFGQNSSKIEQVKQNKKSRVTSNQNVPLNDANVVGAMGIVKKKDAQTYSTQIVKSKELTQTANPNIAQSLIGKVSGLQINTTNNSINPTSRIIIRGNRSISDNNEALIVIDNVISTTDIFTALAPETVDSIYVIKGTQGAALYGMYGANGVIMVRTKLQFDEENSIEQHELIIEDVPKVVVNYPNYKHL
jgi:TonB-dependent SusC/RagA subfamily outer membrane receptor